MKKAGNYLLTAVPLIAGLAIQIVCSVAASMLYGFYHGIQAAASGNQEAVSQSAILEGYSSIILYVLIISQIAAFIVFGIWYKKQNKGREVRHLTQVVHGRTIGNIVFLGIGLQLFTSLFMQVIYRIAPNALNEYADLVETVGIGQANAVSLLATVVLAPIVEEIMFRGVTMRLARKAGAGFLVANLIQAVAFGIYHFNLVQGIYATVLGLVLGYVAYRYDSIYPSILMHLVYNFAATILNALAEFLPDTIVTMVVMVIVMAGTTVIGIWFMKTDKKVVKDKEVIL